MTKNQAIARKIRAELVCCDIYARTQGTEDAGEGDHAICFWGEASARIAESMDNGSEMTENRKVVASQTDTGSLEAEALCAVMSSNDNYLERLLNSMSEERLRNFLRAARILCDEVQNKLFFRE